MSTWVRLQGLHCSLNMILVKPYLKHGVDVILVPCVNVFVVQCSSTYKSLSKVGIFQNQKLTQSLFTPHLQCTRRVPEEEFCPPPVTPPITYSALSFLLTLRRTTGSTAGWLYCANWTTKQRCTGSRRLANNCAEIKHGLWYTTTSNCYSAKELKKKEQKCSCIRRHLYALDKAKCYVIICDTLWTRLYKWFYTGTF